MNIIEPNQLLTTTVNHVVKESMKRFFKDGIELEKGAIITSRRIDLNKALYQNSVSTGVFIQIVLLI